MTTVTERLRAAIRSAELNGVTRYRLSKETGVPNSVLSRFVRGERGLDGATIDRLAAHLGLTLEQTGVPPVLAGLVDRTKRRSPKRE